MYGYNPFAYGNRFTIDQNLLQECFLLGLNLSRVSAERYVSQLAQESPDDEKEAVSEKTKKKNIKEKIRDIFKLKKSSKVTQSETKSEESDNLSNTGLDTFEKRYNPVAMSYRTNLINSAMSYKGNVNSKSEGNALFSPGGKTQAYCADFMTHNVRKIYGSKLPADAGYAKDPVSGSTIGPSAVRGWQLWAKNNNCYIDTTNKEDKNSYIANNVKPGDIMIEKRNGKSHTGIVTDVYTDSSGITWFETIEGNVSSAHKVDTRKYRADSKTLSGFINLDKYLA